MSKRVKFFWVSAGGFIHEVIGGVVRFATDSRYAHCAIGIELPEFGGEVMVEMLMPHIQVQDIHKYDDAPVCFATELPYSDENYARLQEMLRTYITQKRRYGLFEDCVAGGVAAMVSLRAGEWVSDHWAEKFNTTNCSELLTEAIRIEYPQFLSRRSASAVTPDESLMGYFDLATEISRPTPE